MKVCTYDIEGLYELFDELEKCIEDHRDKADPPLMGAILVVMALRIYERNAPSEKEGRKMFIDFLKNSIVSFEGT